jgi:hypothetical protein
MHASFFSSLSYVCSRAHAHNINALGLVTGWLVLWVGTIHGVIMFKFSSRNMFSNSWLLQVFVYENVAEQSMVVHGRIPIPCLRVYLGK